MKETTFQKKDMPHTRKPEGGSWFDDDTVPNLPTPSELASLAIRQELNSRPGTHVHVNQETVEEMASVVLLWRKYQLVSPSVQVYADNRLKPGKVQIRYA